MSFAEHGGRQLGLFRQSTSAKPVAPAIRHHALLGAQLVPYILNQGNQRRRLSLTVDEHGLRVGAPRAVSRGEIDAFITQHGAWILQKLGEIASVSVRRHVRVADGGRLPLLGNDIEIRVMPGANRTRLVANTLILEARADADLNALAQRAIQKQALSHFATRLQHFAPLMEVRPPELRLSSARTRWGSCSRQSGIRINWRLIHLPVHLGDYVLVHELAHLHEMNHGPRFWAWVERGYADWQTARDELRRGAPTLPIL